MDQEEIAATWSGNLASCESRLVFLYKSPIKIEHHCIKSPTKYPYLNHHVQKNPGLFCFFPFFPCLNPWPQVGITKLRWPKLAHNFNASMPQSANSLATEPWLEPWLELSDGCAENSLALKVVGYGLLDFLIKIYNHINNIYRFSMIGSITISIRSLLSTDFLLIFSIESVVDPMDWGGTKTQKRGTHKQFMSAEILMLTWKKPDNILLIHIKKKKHLGSHSVNNVLSWIRAWHEWWLAIRKKTGPDMVDF